MAKNDLSVLAGYDSEGKAVKGSKASVHVLSGQDVTETAFAQKKSGIGLFFTGGGVDIYHASKVANSASEVRNVASSLSADGDLLVKARRDIDIMGLVAAAKGTVTIDARRDVNVGTGIDASGSAYSRKEKGVGLTWSGGNGGFSLGAGYHASSQSAGYDRVSVAPSIIKGDKGVSVTAGDDITMVAANVVSKGHVSFDAGDDINLLAGLNRESSYQTSKEVFAGITLKVNQNVTGAVQQLRQSASTFTSGYGGAQYKVLGGLSGAMQATDAIKSLANPSVSVSLMAGASGSSSQSQAVAYNAVPVTIKGGSVSMTAGDDVHLVGTQVNVKRDLTLDAGGDLTVESAQSYAEAASSSKSWNAGVGVSASSSGSSGVTVEGGFAKSKSGDWSLSQVNAHLNAGGTVTIQVGQDATFAGAVVSGKNVAVDVKGDMTVASRQDLSHSGSSSVNGSGSVTIGLGSGPSSASVSAGGGRSSSDVAWVNEQTGIFATDKVDVTVKNHTQLDGAVFNSDKGQLKLDTGTLGFKDILDHDTGTSISGQVGVTLGTQTLPNGQTPQSTGVNVSGSYASHTIEQETRATIGEGTIKIRDKDKQKQDVAEINRDIDKAQVITKSELNGVNVYASTLAIQQISSIADKAAISAGELIASLQRLNNGSPLVDDPETTGDIGARLQALGGGVPRQVNTPKGATQFIFPNGMVVRFDLAPGQYLPGQSPHINIEWPGTGINYHINLRP